jgi:hypothetical protein
MAHLHAILAADSPVAILIKRGPGRCSCAIGWDRRTDTFETGQWLKQKIESADLSPDGQHFCYFVNTQQQRPEHRVYRVVSRAPWLKALSFWSRQSWIQGPGPGMFFRDVDGEVKLWALPDIPKWDFIGLKTVRELPDTAPWNMMTKGSLQFIQLQRDGWIPVTPYGHCEENEAKGAARWQEKRPHRIIFEKALFHGWTLRQTHWCGRHKDQNRGISWEAFALVSPDGRVHPRPDWEWADVDAVRNRLVWTADRILFAAGIYPSGLGTPNLLLNTNGMRFEPRQAPY